MSVWCCPADIWLHGGKQSRVALEQHWFAKHRKPGKGLLWLVMAEGQISRAGERGSGKWRMRNKIRVWVLQKENWPLCSGRSAILICVPSFKTCFFRFSLVPACLFLLALTSQILYHLCCDFIPSFSSLLLFKSEETDLDDGVSELFFSIWSVFSLYPLNKQAAKLLVSKAQERACLCYSEELKL